MTEFIHVENNGPDIIDTNYYDTPNAAAGYFYLSINAGAFRLLVPDSQVVLIDEFRTGKEVIVSRGPWPDQGRSDALELLFEDNSSSPYALHLVVEQCDRLPAYKDVGKKWVFSVWTRTGKVLGLPAYFRNVKQIPWLKPYTGKRHD